MTRTAMLLASCAAILAAPAQARDGQFYVGVDGGVLLEDQVDVDIDLARPDGLQENAAFADTNIGIDADIVVGYDFGAFRLEAEGGYKRAGYDSLTVVNSDLVPGAGIAPGTVVENEEDLSIFSGMVNGLFEFGKDFQIFAGGGAGIANVDLPVEVAGVGTIIDDSTTDFAWQLLGGFRFAVSDNIDLGLKYRYFVIDEFEFESAFGDPLEADFQSHSILASLRYNFGSAPEPVAAPAPEPAAPPPPPPPPPSPPPAPPPPKPVCNTGPYIVFFDFDASMITAEAATILDSAVTAYSNCGTANVMLAGHTDRAGSVTYNMALAGRRNASVREYLAGRGIPDGRISSEAFGESQPRVPTADGVREAQNRRVEITYGPNSGM